MQDQDQLLVVAIRGLTQTLMRRIVVILATPTLMATQLSALGSQAPTGVG
jgi:hypothetical protein